MESCRYAAPGPIDHPAARTRSTPHHVDDSDPPRSPPPEVEALASYCRRAASGERPFDGPRRAAFADGPTPDLRGPARGTCRCPSAQHPATQLRGACVARQHPVPPRRTGQRRRILAKRSDQAASPLQHQGVAIGRLLLCSWTIPPRAGSASRPCGRARRRTSHVRDHVRDHASRRTPATAPPAQRRQRRTGGWPPRSAEDPASKPTAPPSVVTWTRQH